jgi:hypothetical protein
MDAGSTQEDARKPVLITQYMAQAQGEANLTVSGVSSVKKIPLVVAHNSSFHLAFQPLIYYISLAIPHILALSSRVSYHELRPSAQPKRPRSSDLTVTSLYLRKSCLYKVCLTKSLQSEACLSNEAKGLTGLTAAQWCRRKELPGPFLL